MKLMLLFRMPNIYIQLGTQQKVNFDNYNQHKSNVNANVEVGTTAFCISAGLCARDVPQGVRACIS